MAPGWSRCSSSLKVGRFLRENWKGGEIGRVEESRPGRTSLDAMSMVTWTIDKNQPTMPIEPIVGQRMTHSLRKDGHIPCS